MTFKQFIEAKEELYIHCKNRTQAKTICDLFIKYGKTWKSKDSYEDTFYDVYKGNSCYGNNGKLIDYSDAKILKAKVIEFNNVKGG